MANKNKFNLYQQVWDESAEMLKDPANYLNENHIHKISDVIGLEEKITEYDALKDGTNKHINNKDVHVSEEDRERWDNGGVTVDSGLSGDSTNPVQNKVITEELSKKVSNDTFNEHKNDSVSHVTKEDRDKWDAKSDVVVDDVITSLSDNPVSSKALFKELETKATNEALSKKVSNDTFNEHVSDHVSHVTVADREKWDAKSDVVVDTSLNITSENAISNKAVATEINKKANKTELDNKVGIDDFTDHTQNTTLHVSSAEKEKWNAILDAAKAYVDDVYGSVDKIDFYVIESGKTHVDITAPSISYIYLEKGEGTQYKSWIYRNNEWISTGADELNLSNYYSKNETYNKTEVYTKEESYNKDEIDDKLSKVKANITIDSELSEESENPVQNKILTQLLNSKANTTDLKNKADATTVSEHINNKTSHVTEEDRKRWNNNSGGTVTVDTVLSNTSTNAISNKAVKDALDNKVDTDTLSNYATTEALSNHTSDESLHVTAEEKEKWNNNSSNTSISSEEGNIVEKKPDGLYVPKTDLSTYPTTDDVESMITSDLDLTKLAGTDLCYFSGHHKPNENETTTGYHVTYYTKHGLDQILPMTYNVKANGITVNETGEITLPANKVFLVQLNCRLAVTDPNNFVAFNIYNKTENKYESLATALYLDYTGRKWSDIAAPCIIKTTQETVIYAYICEFFGTKIGLHSQTTITVIELGSQNTINVNNTYAGFNETVLFDGNANTAKTDYALTDSIDNYDLIRIECRDFYEIAYMTKTAIYNPADIVTMRTAIPFEIHMIRPVANGTLGNQIIAVFKDRSTLRVNYYHDEGNYYKSGISRIVGIKKGGETV